MKTALLLAFFIATTVVRGDSGDDTLKFYLSRSDLVATGKIITEPGGVIEEVGVIQYTCDFRVQDVIKGDGARKEQIIKLNIMRFEIDAKDKHPSIKKDGECILFLKSAGPDNPSWVTADFWFGVQHPSPWMARSLKRLAADK